MQNGDGNAGQAATYSRAQVKGVTISPEIDALGLGVNSTALFRPIRSPPLSSGWR
jgi:hypothetical protein